MVTIRIQKTGGVLVYLQHENRKKAADILPWMEDYCSILIFIAAACLGMRSRQNRVCLDTRCRSYCKILMDGAEYLLFSQIAAIIFSSICLPSAEGGGADGESVESYYSCAVVGRRRCQRGAGRFGGEKKG